MTRTIYLEIEGKTFCADYYPSDTPLDRDEQPTEAYIDTIQVCGDNNEVDVEATKLLNTLTIIEPKLETTLTRLFEKEAEKLY